MNKIKLTKKDISFFESLEELPPHQNTKSLIKFWKKMRAKIKITRKGLTPDVSFKEELDSLNCGIAKGELWLANKNDG